MSQARKLSSPLFITLIALRMKYDLFPFPSPPPRQSSAALEYSLHGSEKAPRPHYTVAKIEIPASRRPNFLGLPYFLGCSVAVLCSSPGTQPLYKRFLLTFVSYNFLSQPAASSHHPSPMHGVTYRTHSTSSCLSPPLFPLPCFSPEINICNQPCYLTRPPGLHLPATMDARQLNQDRIFPP